MLKGFGQFIARGNVVDLAVAVVMGAAFGAVVTALVKDIITPLIAAVFGKPDFGALAFTLNHSTFAVGDFINAVVAFLLVAIAIYFFIVAPMNGIMLKTNLKQKEPAAKECPHCLSQVPAAASRCKFCCADMPAAA